MKTFCKAQKFSGVNIDENLVCTSVRWLIQNQRGAGFPALVYGRHLAVSEEICAFLFNTLYLCQLHRVTLIFSLRCKLEEIIKFFPSNRLYLAKLHRATFNIPYGKVMLSVLKKININVLDAHRTFLETRNDFAKPSRPVSQTQLKPSS